MNPFKSALRPFLVALAAAALVLVVRRLVFIPLFDISAPVMPFLLAVIAATLFDGTKSGIFATILGVAIGSYLRGDPVPSADAQLRLVLFVFIGGLMSWALGSLRSNERRLQDRQQQLAQEVGERRRTEALVREQRDQLANEVLRREEAERELREREETLRMAADSGNVGIWDFNPLTGEHRWSPRSKTIFGLPPDADVTDATFLERVHPEDRDRVIQAIKAASEPSGDGKYEAEYRIIWPDETVRWILARGQAIFEGENTNHRASRGIGTVIDITERKHAEERFRKVATNAPVGIFETDNQGRCRFVNEAWCEIAGATLEDALGDGWQRFLHPEDRQRVLEEWQEATLHGRNHVVEFRFLNQRTGVRYVIASATVILASTSVVTGYVGTIVDVTQRKAAEDVARASEARLREQEERVRLAVEAADIGTWDVNPVTGEQEWSSRAKVMFGLSADADLSNVSFRDRVHPEDRERVNQALQRAYDPSGDGVYEVDCRIVWPDNTIHWFIAKGQVLFEGEKPNRRASRLIGTALDITDRKHAEEVIRASESRLQAIMDNTSAVIYLKDLQGRFLMINKRFEKLLNVDQQQFIGKTDADIFPSDVVAKIHAHDRQVRETGRPLEFEEVVPHKDGPHTYVAVKFPISDANGTVVGVGGISTDITDRKAIENVVRASEIRLRGILDHMPAAISLKDLEGRYVLVNRGFEGLFGAKSDELVGHTNYDLISKARSNQMSKELADLFVRIDRKVIRTGELVTFEDSMPSGDDPRLFATVKFPIKDASGRITGVGGISIDVTERRKAMDSLAAEQEMLQHTIQFQDHERQLVAYEIHDGLVQYATGALMQLEGIQHQVESDALARQIETVVGILRKTVDEGRRLISGLHATVLDDCGVVAAVQELLDNEERTDIEVEFVKDGRLGRMARKSEEALYRITQEALTNFYKHSQSNKVRIELSRHGDRVHLKVSDWGVGFTPDANAKGVHGLRGMTERAKIAGGQCTIRTAVGGGTQVVVDLPYLSRN